MLGQYQIRFILVVQEKLSATLQRAKLRLAETMGFDVEQMMAEDLAGQEKDNKSREGSVEKSASARSSVSINDQKANSNDNPNFTLKSGELGSSLKERREKRNSPKPDGKDVAAVKKKNSSSK